MKRSFLIRSFATLWCSLLLIGGSLRAQPSRAVQAQRAAACTIWLQQHLYMTEAAGYNRHPLIDAWARANGNAPGSEWCGLTQWACQKAVKLPTPPGPAGSYNWFKDIKRTYYVRGVRGVLDSVRVGHPVGIYNAKRGRIAHIMRVVKVVPGIRPGRPPRSFYTIAGNEGSGPTAGMRLTLYAAPSIYAAANWLY